MFRFVVLLALVLAVFAEDIEFSECGRDKSANCGIKAVRLTPCKETTIKNPCKLTKGKAYGLEFDFEPEFVAEKLEAKLAWVNALNIDLPLPGMDTDGCHSTHCPLIPQQINQFSYNLTMQGFYPRGKYNVKCLLKKDQANECCFEFAIRIL